MDPALSPGIISDSLALGDLDGDGHKDIATGSMVLGRKDLVHLWRPDTLAQLDTFIGAIEFSALSSIVLRL